MHAALRVKKLAQNWTQLVRTVALSFRSTGLRSDYCRTDRQTPANFIGVRIMSSGLVIVNVTVTTHRHRQL